MSNSDPGVFVITLPERGWGGLGPSDGAGLQSVKVRRFAAKRTESMADDL